MADFNITFEEGNVDVTMTVAKKKKIFGWYPKAVKAGPNNEPRIEKVYVSLYQYHRALKQNSIPKVDGISPVPFTEMSAKEMADRKASVKGKMEEEIVDLQDFSVKSNKEKLQNLQAENDSLRAEVEALRKAKAEKAAKESAPKVATPKVTTPKVEDTKVEDSKEPTTPTAE